MRHREEVVFYLNGIRRVCGPEEARMMLGDYLRKTQALAGTKIVCAEGDCGACSVLKWSRNPANLKRSLFLPINSCITTVAQLDCSIVVTVDALAEAPDALTPVQRALVESDGSQCGFCTPGFVIALTGLVEKKLCAKSKDRHCSAREAKNATTGNLCRCTGYQPIVDGATKVDLSNCTTLASRFVSAPTLRELERLRKIPLLMRSSDFTFYAPRTLKDASRYLAKAPDARTAALGTDLGVVANKGKLKLDHLLSLHLVPELFTLKASRTQIEVGARVTLSELRDFCKKRVPEFATFLDLFASPQIKNNATLIGNIGNASPIADTPPFLLATHAILTLVGPRGQRKVPLEQFYLAYRKTALKRGEIISKVVFEIPTSTDILKLYKVSQRKDLDISTVNAAFRIRLKKQTARVEEICISMGGVAATPLRLPKTERVLLGKSVSDPAVLAAALHTLQSEITPLSDLRGSSAFRRVVAHQLFERFWRGLT